MNVQAQRNEHGLFIYTSSSFLPLPNAGSLPGGENPSEPQRPDQGQGIFSPLFDGETQSDNILLNTIFFKVEKYQMVGDNPGP